MKKILFSIALLFSTLIFATNVNASSFNVNIVGNDTFENEITLYLKVNNLVDFNGVCNGLCGIVGDLSYDKEKLELTSINALENFDLTQGKTLVLYKSTGVASGTKILSMKFKNKSLIKDETTTISLSNITASDGDKDIQTNDVSKIIKYVINNNDITNKPSSSTTKKSSNNYLSSITLSNGSIKFDKNVLIYDVIVDSDVSTIEIKVKAEDDKAIIVGDGKYNLNVGNNVINIVIKAEDETERTYTLNINREENENVVDIDKNFEEYDVLKTDSNRIILIVIVSIILVAGIISFVVLKRKKNK